MYLKNRPISLAYKIVAIAVCIWGQLLASGMLEGSFDIKKYFYYTQQSNVLCLIYFILASVYCIKAIRKSGSIGPAAFAPRFKGAAVLAITVTMLIYWTMLHSPGHPDINMQESIVAHLLVPLLMIFDWLLFDPKGAYRKTDPLLWLCIPMLYWLFTLIVAQTGFTYSPGRRYPYPFIDLDSLGWSGVLKYVLVLVLVFLVIGYLFFGLDRLLARFAKQSNTK